jgi:hypothetical protein
MNAHGKAGRAASVISAVAALLLMHTAAADDTIVVYGKRLEMPEQHDLELPQFDSAGFLAALHDDIRASLRDDLRALRAQLEKDRNAARQVKVAALDTRTGV